MKKAGKDKDLKLNIIIGIASQILLIFTNLISKKAIQWCLGLEYLGMQTVFANIGDLLTFAFSGIGAGVLYSFIRPIEENNSKKIQKLYRYYNKIYRVMTAVSITLGVLAAIAVPFIIDAEIKTSVIIAAYLLYLLAVIIYNRYLIFHYILVAYQKRYIVCLLSGIIEIVALIAEVILLMVSKRYEAFLYCFLIKNILINGSVYLYLKKKYGYFFQGNASHELKQTEKKEILVNIRDLIVFRVGGVLINNTDSILISTLISTVTSGCYSNYCFISGGVLGLTNSFFESIIAKVGSIAVNSSKEEFFRNFWKVSVVGLWINGFSVTCFYLLIQDFIKLWMGNGSILSWQIVLVVTLNLYLDGMKKTAATYRKSAGLFHKFERLVIFRGILNLVLSVILGKVYGLIGILVATSISNVCTIYWYTPYRLYLFFEKSWFYELLYQLLGAASTLGCIYVTGMLVSGIDGSNWLGFFIKAACCVIVSNSCYMVYAYVYKIVMRKRIK